MVLPSVVSSMKNLVRQSSKTVRMAPPPLLGLFGWLAFCCFVVVVCFVFFEAGSLCVPGWCETQCVDYDGLRLTEICQPVECWDYRCASQSPKTTFYNAAAGKFDFTVLKR